MQSFLYGKFCQRPPKSRVVSAPGLPYIRSVKVWEAIFVMMIGAAVAQEQPPLTEDQRKAQELLKKTVEERQKNQPPAQTNVPPRLTQAEIEQQYLSGKITAKQFQQYLRQQPPTKPQLTPEKQAEALQILRALTSKTNTPPAAAAAGKVVEPVAEPGNPAITDVEAKIRELEKAKQARETSTNAPSATPKTKREKLDLLLKQFVEGKISEEDYKQQRAKVIAGPD